MALTRDQLLSFTQRRIEPVYVPEFGGEVFVRSLTAAEHDWLSVGVVGTNGRGNNLQNFRARIVVLCACDKDGQALFGREDVDAVGALPSSAINRIVEKFQQLEPTLEDAEKN